MTYVFTVETKDDDYSEELRTAVVKILEKVKGVIGVTLGKEQTVEELEEIYKTKAKQNKEIIFKISDLLNELLKD